MVDFGGGFAAANSDFVEFSLIRRPDSDLNMDLQTAFWWYDELWNVSVT